ncbi:hypothetical protein SeLEV6574_g00003 [Synchytrium endobioticum]|uniref:(d)CMP kinase n=1 Tax=Synchytrium endobioticum TaxID=286115 RepID=A0A507DKR1_9FUNG|nr:hypothetical protein SeLEV6574_g00003 [Synchytrium endobioticum]
MSRSIRSIHLVALHRPPDTGIQYHLMRASSSSFTKANSTPFKIAIDGEAASGKSSLAKTLAARLPNFVHLNSGAIFRAITYLSLQNSLLPSSPPLTPSTIAQIASLTSASLSISLSPPSTTPCINTTPVPPETLHSPLVTTYVQTIAPIPEIRTLVLQKQLNFIKAYPRVIVEGRDIGSVVMPDADIKIYLTANENARAARRLEEDARRYGGDGKRVEDVKKELHERDARDKNRSVAPLVVPKNAVVIDSSGKTLEQVTELVIKLITKKLVVNTVEA